MEKKNIYCVQQFEIFANAQIQIPEVVREIP